MQSYTFPIVMNSAQRLLLKNLSEIWYSSLARGLAKCAICIDAVQQNTQAQIYKSTHALGWIQTHDPHLELL